MPNVNHVTLPEFHQITSQLLVNFGVTQSTLGINIKLKTAGTKELSDYIEANVVYGEGQEADIEYAISNTFGFGGHNAVLAFKRWEA